MILKQAVDKEPQIKELESLLSVASSTIKPKIEKELFMLRAGIKGEQETTYHIDFNLRDSENYAVIHDLRLEINDKVAQIDHLLINRTLRIYCIETKHLNSGIKITDDGEFVQWNSYKKVYEGISSPLAQNQRHIDVLDEIFDTSIKLPERLGFILYPSFHSRVVVNSNARVDRSRKFDSKDLVKSEKLYESIKKDFDSLSLSLVLKTVSYEEIENIANQLIALHKPIKINYRAKFGLDISRKIEPISNFDLPVQVNTSSTHLKVSEADSNPHRCKKCNSSNVKIQYGKFGYYYKCGDCESNTNIKIDCSVVGHNAKLRKDGNRFFKDCIECESSYLYFEN